MKIPSLIIILAAACYCQIGLATELNEQGKASGLENATRMFLERYTDEIAAKGYRSEYETGNIDPRLNIKACASGWEVSFSRDPAKQANTSLIAECKDAENRKLYVNCKFSIFAPAVISKHLIARGQRLTEHDLKTEDIQINVGHYEAYSDTTHVVGMIAKRNIKPGKPIRPAQLAAPRLVNRGDDVIIIAANPNISIKMKGEALNDGTLGEQISVKNKQSKRVIRARVTHPGIVEVTL